MMTIHKIASGDTRGYADYLSSHSESRSGDYYLGREGRPVAAAGVWHGRAASELGLSGGVGREALVGLWDGRHPDTGRVLVKRSTAGEHVAAVDCTFSAPKSVSVVWALSDPSHRETLERLQDRSVSVALDHIERNAPLVRRRVAGEIIHERVGGLVVARFRHHTSRLCSDQHAGGVVPDPQLHDHCAIANMALRRGDSHAVNGRWGAIDSRELYRIAAEAGAVYRAELAAGLIELGYSLDREGRYFEIAGISRDLRDAFSARSLEVKAAIAKFVETNGRRPTEKEERQLVVLTRGQKGREGAPAFAEWRKRALDIGVDPSSLTALRGNRPGLPEFGVALRSVVRDLTDPDSPRSLVAKDSTVDRRHLRIAVAEAAQSRISGGDVDRLIEAVQSSSLLVHLDDDKVTTRDLLRMESEVLRMAVSTRHGAPADDEAIDQAIAAARVALSPEQVAAVQSLCRGSALSLLVAPAGAGKGEVLAAVADAYRRSGRRVVALAAAGETAQRLGDEIGTDEARTIDSFTRADRDDLDGTVLVVDEGALLETRRWHALLKSAAGARVIAAGDDRQLSPIKAGGLWKQLERSVPVSGLSANFRASDAWARDAWAALREGASDVAISEMNQRRLVELSANREQSRAAAVKRWDKDRRDGAQRGRGVDQYLLLTDSSNVEVDLMNQMAQARRLARGELGAQAVTVNFRDAETGHNRCEKLRVGDRVAFEKQLYIRGVGQRTRRIENGERGEVVAVDANKNAATVRVKGREVVVDNGRLDSLRLGYAQHVYSAQGRTVDRTYVLLGGWQTDRERSYVAVSRSREQSVVISDYSSLEVAAGDRAAALKELAERCSVSHRKEAALNLIRQVAQIKELRGRETQMRDMGRYRDVPVQQRAR